jgi:hypothetical protein
VTAIGALEVRNLNEACMRHVMIGLVWSGLDGNTKKHSSVCMLELGLEWTGSMTFLEIGSPCLGAQVLCENKT